MARKPLDGYPYICRPFSDVQREVLERIYCRFNYLNPREAGNLAKIIRDTKSRVMTWFSRRRSKDKSPSKESVILYTCSSKQRPEVSALFNEVLSKYQSALGNAAVNPSAQSSPKETITKKIFNSYEKGVLDRVYGMFPYLKTVEAKTLAKRIEITTEQVMAWFMNKRRTDPQYSKETVPPMHFLR